MAICTDFGEFLKVIEKQKERAAKFDDESDMSALCGVFLQVTGVTMGLTRVVMSFDLTCS